MTVGRSFVRALVLASLAVGGCDRASDTVKTGTPSVPAAWPHPLNAPDVAAPHGVVVSDAPLASRVGADVLRGGGTAVGAAVATAFALAVTLPSAGNVGGGGFAVVVGQRANSRTGLSGNGARGRDTKHVSRRAGRRDGPIRDRAPRRRCSRQRRRAVGKKFGTKPWADLVNPAIVLAERGFSVDSDFASAIADEAKRLSKLPASAALFLPAGANPAEGSSWSDPDLAQVLKRIAAHGRDGFYTGHTAALIVAEMKRGGGVMTGEDLERYEPKWREPVAFTYRGRRAVSMPPPSSGGVTLAMIAQQLEAYDLGKLGWHSVTAIHLQAEAMRRAFAVRNDLLGDPDFVTLDLGRLSSKA